MKFHSILALIPLFICSCSGTGNKTSVNNSGTTEQEEHVSSARDTIIESGSDFKAYVANFTRGKFPFNLNVTPLLADGDLPQDFHPMSLENIHKYINPDAAEVRGYFTGYAMYEKEYIALISFYNYSNMFGGDNYHTSVDLQTYTYEGTNIARINLGEKYTMVNSSAQRVTREIDGFVRTDTISVIHYRIFLEDKLTESAKPLIFVIKPDGGIDLKDNEGAADSLKTEGKS